MLFMTAEPLGNNPEPALNNKNNASTSAHLGDPFLTNDRLQWSDMKSFLLAISSVIVVWLPVLLLHLTLVLFATLITYALIRGIAGWIHRHVIAYMHSASRQQRMGKVAEWFAIAILATIISLTVYVFGDWIADKASVDVFNNLIRQILDIFDQLHTLLPASISQHLPISVSSFQAMLMSTIKSHASQLQLVGIHTLRGLGYVLAGVVIGCIVALQVPVNSAAHKTPFTQHLRQKFDELIMGFNDVFFAQVKISSINTILTSVFLLGILPILGHPLPMAWTVVLITFCAGLFPVVGNLVSNVVIVLLSLTHGLGISILSLVWLVSIHKLEYFLNAQIIGHKIRASAWELLLFILVLEATFGLAGLISAPVIYAQIKRILADRGWVI